MHNIREARLAIGVTQSQLAEKLEISRQSMIKYENGEAPNYIVYAVKWLEYCNKITQSPVGH